MVDLATLLLLAGVAIGGVGLGSSFGRFALGGRGLIGGGLGWLWWMVGGGGLGVGVHGGGVAVRGGVVERAVGRGRC